MHGVEEGMREMLPCRLLCLGSYNGGELHALAQRQKGLPMARYSGGLAQR